MTLSPAWLPKFPASVRFLDRPPLAAATALRGQVVAVLFWRAGCVHSRQALAELAEFARERVGRPFAVLAVHVPTVAAERDEQRVRRACALARDAVTVAIDAERALCRAVDIAALPSLLLLDGEGEICFSGRGEPNRLRLAEAVDALLALVKEQELAVPVALTPVAPPPPRGLGLSALASDGARLWVASTAHRAVFAITTAGEVAREIGGFAMPAGIGVHGGQVLVSDSGSHELRAIDVESGEVETVLGTGRRGTDRFGGGFGDQQPLCSPAGICSHDGAVYFAQAGGHQIWQFDPETQAASPWLGTGQRSMCDGGEHATFAEPLGIACDDGAMFVADAGNDALRAVDLAHNFVRTVAEYLPRPTALAVRDGEVFVAAGWQPAIVRSSASGSEREVVCDGSHGLVEPIALAFHAGELWVADAGADALFAIDVDSRPATVRRVDLGLPPLVVPMPANVARLASPIAALEFSDLTLRIHLPCASGEQLDTGAPCEVDLVDERDPVLAADRHAAVAIDGDHAPVLVPIDQRGDGVLRVRARATVRVGADARPIVREFRYVVPITVGSEGAVEADVRAAEADPDRS